MLALRYHGNKDLRLEDIPDPSPGPGEVRVRCRYTSICATDIEEWQYGPLWVQYGSPNPLSGRSAPLVMGHEISGVIDSVGQGVAGWSPGERVVVNNVRTCGSCFWCTRSQQAVCPNMAVAGLSADGGLAEYMTWPADMIVRLPDSIPDEAAPLTEPAMVGVHAARRSGVKPGDTVCVLGCGTVGLMTVQAFAASGARVIAVDVRQKSLNMARDLSADVTIDAGTNDVSAALLELTDGIGPDIVVETAGAADTPVQAIEWCRRGGTVVLVGIYSATPRVNFNDIVGVEKTVIGSVASSPGDMKLTVDLIARGKIKTEPLVSSVIPLSRALEDGFERMIAPGKDVFRIVVQPGE
jgi:(R,R)-butanediol dehydrogenase/meso-butanediol dehydrogenase/diacetyl reductase